MEGDVASGVDSPVSNILPLASLWEKGDGPMCSVTISRTDCRNDREAAWPMYTDFPRSGQREDMS